jgi:transketolase
MINIKDYIATKTGFGEGLKEAATHNDRIIGLGCDITSSVGMNIFKDAFPERFFSLGIAEQNAAAVAAGFALDNLIPVFSTYSVFATTRALDQIRISICYNNLPVIIGGAHAGISVGPDGATHQALEDIAIMRSLPNMTVISPCDATQTKLATIAATKLNKPVYIRFGRNEIADFTDENQNFEIGKAQVFNEGDDIAIFATGSMLYHALKAAENLQKENIKCSVINIHTIKPLDEECIIKYAKKSKAIVSVEEHQIYGGLGSAIAECLAKNHPTKMKMIGINDSFGESGQAEELLVKYGLTPENIEKTVKSLL